MKLLICGHDNYGECVFSTLKFFKNDIDDYVSYLNDDGDFISGIKEYFARNNGDDVIVITDILGGNPNAEVIKAAKGTKARIISGLNIGGMLELLFREEITDREIADIVSGSRSVLVYVNQLFGRKDD